MIDYLIAFVFAFWPTIHGAQERDMRDTSAEVMTTDCVPQECLRLMNIAALESGFRKDAVGKSGEKGRWQIMPPAASYDASEALWRMRHQGMLGYVGCRHENDVVVLPGDVRTTCRQMIAHRIDRADLWLMGFEPPHVAAPLVGPAVAEIDRAHE